MTMPYQPAAFRATQPGERVGPLKALRNFFGRGFQFSGRASRSDYWWIALYAALLSWGGQHADEHDYFSGPLTDGAEWIAVVYLLLALALLAAAILCVVFGIALSVRRLHDANLSGLWYLLILVPFLGAPALLILVLLPPDPRGVRFDNQLLPQAPGAGSP